MPADPPAPGSASSVTDTHAKALRINLDSSVYGSFAEIGAGQEVARWFLSVGAASGTVAQTISAYDKTFSDDTYGAGTRYVSRDRLRSMLEHEYSLLARRLGGVRGKESRFFAFANTVAARNYKGDNEQHGWIGLRFQGATGAPPSQILIHVNLQDPTAQLQQQALGILGVNLLYAASYQCADRDEFLAGLWDSLSLDRLEIDYLDLSGPSFANQDARLWALHLLQRGMARAIAFDQHGALATTSEFLRKRPLVIDRGRFASVEPYHAHMLAAAMRQLAAEGGPLERDPIGLLEFSLRPAGAEPVHIGAELLERVQRLSSVAPVLTTMFSEGYELVTYLNRYTTEPLRFVLGVSLLARMLEDRFYSPLPGRLLEGLGKVFARHVRIYAAPMPRRAVETALGPAAKTMVADSGSDLVGLDDLRPESPASFLFQYLRAGGWVVPLTN